MESLVHRLASINQICEPCRVRIGTQILEANLILLPMSYFDVILGMDWLSKWGVTIDCQNKRVQIEGIPKEEMQINKVRQSRDVPVLVSAVKAAKMIRQQCTAYLVSISISEKVEKPIEQISVVREFQDIFPKELRQLPPERDMDTKIEIIPGVAPISKAPYRMAPAEMAELKAQI